MKKEYNLSKMRKRKNPYAKRLKKQITIRINVEAIDYFKSLSAKTGVSYQKLMDLYLTDCVHSNRELKFKWVA